ncbi:MAG: O-antigen ligase family protein [Lachnospiraceae bacterium]|nr:O-antigen ligase family protein [Lachnospiraceae bacterium]
MKDRELTLKDKDGIPVNTAAKKGEKVFKDILSVLSVIYCVIIFAGLPLLYHNGYYDIGEFKYSFFFYATVSYICISVFILILFLLAKVFFFGFDPLSVIGIIKSVTVTDRIAVTYLFICIISFILCRYNTWAFFGENVTNPPLKGYYGWHMGLISQCLFVIIYFLVSRTLKGNFRKILLFSLLAGSLAVFILGVFHRFLVDPLGLYKGIDPAYRIYFLSTLGQATWFSSFLCTVMPVAMALFIFDTRNRYRIAYAVYISIASMALVTQNSDSAFIALFVVLATLLMFSLDANNHLIMYLQLVVLILLSFRFIGILQLIFKSSAVKLGNMPVFFSQSVFMLLFTLLVIALYLGISYYLSEHDLHISRHPSIRYVVILLILIPVAICLMIVILATGGYINAPGGIFSEEYVVLNDHWGNGRGFTWRITIEMFRDFSLQEKLFGIGPDCYADYAYEYRYALIKEKWGTEVLANAHNEWLNSIFTTGIAGFVSYIGIFISSAVCFIKKRKANILCIGITASIFAYISHNSFCYQQVLCTPMLFVLTAFSYAVIFDSEKKTDN